MFQAIQNQLQWRADLLLAGRYEDLSREYLYPLAVYLEDNLISLQSPDDAVATVNELHTILQPMDISDLRITVTAVELQRHGRFRVWATWRGFFRQPTCAGETRVIYYMRDTAQGFRTEMLHYLQVGNCALRCYRPAQNLRA